MFRDALLKVMARVDLSSAEAAAAMDDIVDGRVEAAQVAGLLVGLAMKGERPDEIVGFAAAMRDRAIAVGRWRAALSLLTSDVRGACRCAHPASL